MSSNNLNQDFELINFQNKCIGFIRANSTIFDPQSLTSSIRTFLTDITQGFDKNDYDLPEIVCQYRGQDKKKYFVENNFTICTNNAKKNMKELIYKNKFIEDNSLFDLIINILEIYIFYCLFKSGIDTEESCSSDSDDRKYWISEYIQLSDTENSKNLFNDNIYE